MSFSFEISQVKHCFNNMLTVNFTVFSLLPIFGGEGL